jgi:hypothetical protein
MADIPSNEALKRLRRAALVSLCNENALSESGTIPTLIARLAVHRDGATLEPEHTTRVGTRRSRRGRSIVAVDREQSSRRRTDDPPSPTRVTSPPRPSQDRANPSSPQPFLGDFALETIADLVAARLQQPPGDSHSGPTSAFLEAVRIHST